MSIRQCRHRDCAGIAAFNGQCLPHLFPNAHNIVSHYVKGYSGYSTSRLMQFCERLAELGIELDLSEDVARAILESIDWGIKIKIGDWTEDKMYDTVQIRSTKSPTRRKK